MPMTLKEGLQVWADRWRNLKAWKKGLDHVEIAIRQRHEGCWSTGVTYAMTQRLAITAPNMPLGLEVLLHELAHVAVPADVSHGEKWREAFVAAIGEVTGIVVSPAGNLPELTQASEAAVATWWKNSGNQFAWKLIVDKKGGGR